MPNLNDALSSLNAYAAQHQSLLDVRDALAGISDLAALTEIAKGQHDDAVADAGYALADLAGLKAQRATAAADLLAAQGDVAVAKAQAASVLAEAQEAAQKILDDAKAQAQATIDAALVHADKIAADVVQAQTEADAKVAELAAQTAAVEAATPTMREQLAKLIAGL